MKELKNILENKFEIKEFKQQKEDLFFLLGNEEQIEPLLLFLKNQQNFKTLTFLQAVDFIEIDKFQLVYMLYNPIEKVNLAAKFFIDREEAKAKSIHNIWPYAWQYQRELKELFGIDFPNSPRLNENFVLEGWEDLPPMRKDFKTKEYSINTYYPREGRTTDYPKKYMKKKLYKDFVSTPNKRRNK